MEQISSWSDDMYQFVLVMMDHMKQPHNYGTSEKLNMVEIHTLSMIAAQPGVCVSDVAKFWNRTLSAASRNVDRLHTKGYIEKKKLHGNSKNVHLYVTDKGQQLADFHRRLDDAETKRFSEFIVKKCSMEDLEKFNHVLKIIQEFYDSHK